MIVATYNLHCCIGADRRTDVGRVLDVIRELSPDIIAVQEVLTGKRGARHDQLGYLADALGMVPIEGATLTRQEAGYGNGILTRLPVVSVARHELGQRGHEPRCALEIEVLAASNRRVRVLATHLGLAARERHAQLDTLLETTRGSTSRPLVFAGDFNVWLPFGMSARRLRRRFGVMATPRTFPANRPLLALDRIFVEPAHLLQEVRVHHSMLARTASDHLPVCARIDLASPSP